MLEPCLTGWMNFITRKTLTSLINSLSHGKSIVEFEILSPVITELNDYFFLPSSLSN